MKLLAYLNTFHLTGRPPSSRGWTAGALLNVCIAIPDHTQIQRGTWLCCPHVDGPHSRSHRGPAISREPAAASCVERTALSRRPLTLWRLTRPPSDPVGRRRSIALNVHNGSTAAAMAC
eukprot:jgi/Ulvmu1/10974/UM007_0153.1